MLAIFSFQKMCDNDDGRERVYLFFYFFFIFYFNRNGSCQIKLFYFLLQELNKQLLVPLFLYLVSMSVILSKKESAYCT